MNSSPQDNRPKKEDQSWIDRLKDTFESWRANAQFGKVYDYAKSNNRDTIAYILLVVGLFLLFFEPWFGGILIGIIFGLYFSQEITDVIVNHVEIIDKLGIARSMVLAFVLLVFLISAPFVFIGAALAVCLKRLV
jgi:hypothetical protein